MKHFRHGSRITSGLLTTVLVLSLILPGQNVRAEELLLEETNLVETSQELFSEEALSEEELLQTEDLESEPINDVDADFTDEGAAEEGTAEEVVDAVFPGLSYSARLSDEQMSEKTLLADYSDELAAGLEGVDYVKDQIMVKAESEELAGEYAAAYNGTLLHYEYGLALIELNADDSMETASVADAVSLSSDASISLPAAWPNYLGKPTATYLDPYLSLYNANYQYQHAMLESELAWEAGYTGSGVKVCVFDTGVLANHSDLNIKGKAYYKNSTTGIVGGSAPDSIGHGTHVTGIIGARGNGQMGVGIAPDADLYTIGVYDSTTGETPAYAMICGLHYALGNWVPDVINCSIAYYGYDPYMEEVMNLAYEKGAVIFCSAGNEGSNQIVYPAGFANTVSVGAVDADNKPAYFTNSNANVRYSAPGVDIVSTHKGSSTSYKKMTGTSQATAVMSGAAAVILSSGRVEGTGPARVRNLLALMDRSCVKSGLGKGTINLRMALGLSRKSSEPKAPTATPSQTFTQESTSVSVSTEPGTYIYYTINGANPTYKDGNITGTKLNQNVKTINISGTGQAVLKMIAVNLSTGVCSKMSTYTYYFKPKVTQVNVYSPSGVTKVAKGGSIQLKATVLPSNAGNSKLNWQVSGFPTGITVKNGVVKVGKNVTVTKCTVLATATDGSGITGSFEVQIADSPKVGGITTNLKKNKLNLWLGDVSLANQNVDLTVKLTDKTIVKASDYTVWKSLNTSIADVSVMGNILTIRGKARGTCTVQGTAKDGSGKTCTITVTVRQYVTSVAVNPIAGGQLKIGTGTQLTGTASPQNAENNKLGWTLTSVPYGTTKGTCGVSITSGGKIKTTKSAVQGTYGFTATALDRGTVNSTEYKLNITSSGISKLTLSKTTDRIFRVSNTELAPTKTTFSISLEGGSSTSLAIANSAPGLVTVSRNGLTVTVSATGTGIGTAVVTVASTDGSNIKKTCKVTVANPATKLSLSLPKGHSSYLAYGTSMSLVARVYGDQGTIDKTSSTYTWESSNPDAVSVNEKGLITSKLVGGSDKPITITCRTADGSNLAATYLIYPVGNTRKMEAQWEEAHNRFVLTSYCDTSTCVLGDDYLIKVNNTGVSADITTSSNGSITYLNVYSVRPGNYTITVTKADGSKGKCIAKISVK